MNQINVKLLVVFLTLGACHLDDQELTAKKSFLVTEVPNRNPIPFKPELISSDQIIHRGVFSNDLKEYYYAVSDKEFSRFDVKVITKQGGKWSEPSNAFFNSEFSDHGMSFSPDGKMMFFSSTRPTKVEGVASTWHIWKVENNGNRWAEPEFIDLSNLRDRLVSHPTLSPEGTLYFHSSELDYSSMEIYYSILENGKFQDAQKLNLTTGNTGGHCTPYVDPKGEYLLFASIGESIDLYVCYRNGELGWSLPQKLPEAINIRGQGNPYVTSDGQYLFYAQEQNSSQQNWSVSWIPTNQFLDRNR